MSYFKQENQYTCIYDSQNISPLIVLTLVSPTQEISFHPRNMQPYLDSQMVVNLQISEKKEMVTYCMVDMRTMIIVM